MKTRLTTMLNLLALLTVVLGLTLAKSHANPNWARDFHGQVNFTLDQDPQINGYRRQINQLEQRIRALSKKLKDLERQIAPHQKRENELTKKVAGLQKALETLIKEQQAANKKKNQLVIQKGKNAEAQLTVIAETETIKQQLAKSRKAAQKAKTALETANSIVKNAQNAFNTAKTNYQTKKDECVAGGSTPDVCETKPPVKKAKQRMNNMMSKLNEAKSLQQVAKNNFDAKNKIVQQNAKALKQKQQRLSTLKQKHQQLKTQIANLTNAIAGRKNKIANTRTKLQNSKQTLAQVRQTIKPLRQKRQELANKRKNVKARLAETTDELQRERRKLVRRILNVNDESYRYAISYDGQRDGHDVAQDQGEYHGQNDGRMDGLDEGERIGREREYDSGYAQGLLDGKARADSEGNASGFPEGRSLGNSDAGTREGSVAGAERAEQNRPNAEELGKNQGIYAGGKRAKAVGRERGRPVGQQQGIDKFENRDLEVKEVPGKFAATFSYYAPSFPGPSNRFFNAYYCNNYPRELVRMACEEGYRVGYFHGAEQSYYDVIESIYDDYYTSAFDEAKAEALAVYYRDSYDRGQVDGDAHNFNEWYRHFHNQYRDEAREQFSNNPERNSQDYKQSWTIAEQSTFARITESYRLASFNKWEEATFAANIANETEFFRKERLAQVENLYNTSPVVSYVGSKITDAGIGTVAALDGIYQPGETVVYNVTLKNFATVAAKGVQVFLNSGEAVTLPDLPAGTVTTVRGAIKTSIQKNVGSRESRDLISRLALSANTAEDLKVQGRHYHSRSSGQINPKDKKVVNVEYPLVATSISSQDELILGKKTGLTINVKNKSLRKYTGPIEIELSNTLGNSTIIKGFSNIDVILTTNGVSKSDAMIEISNEEDAYSTMVVTANIYKGDVLLGTTMAPLRTFAKIKYIEKQKAPVVVADGNQSLRELQSVIAQLGGPTSISILDLSVAEQNSDSILAEGFENKRIMIIGKGDLSKLVKLAGQGIKKSKYSFFAFTSDNDDFAEKVRTSIKEINKAYSGRKKDEPYNTWFPVEFPGYENILVASTNEFVFKKTVQATTTITPFDIRDAGKIAEIGTYFTMNPQMLANEIKKQITPESYLNPTVKIKKLMSIMNFRIMEDIMKLNTGWVLSKKGRFIFSRFNKKWSKALTDGKEKRLFVRKLEENMDSVGILLASHGSLKTLSHLANDYDQVDKNIQWNFESKVTGYLKKRYSKAMKELKNKNKDLYKKVKKTSKYRFVPFNVNTNGWDYDDENPEE